MNTYNAIREWLSSSIRNRFYFSQNHFYTVETIPYTEAVRMLRDSLRENFTRQEYLEWVELWKATYAKITSDSRLAKEMRSTTEIARIGNKTADEAISIGGTNHQFTLKFKTLSWMMMSMRTRSKEIAKSAYAREQELA